MSSYSHIRFVFLDRDGVINQKAPEGEYVSDWAGFHLLPGVESAIASLNHSGRHVIVVSNQRGIALGRYSRADVEVLHDRLQRHLAICGAHIDAFYICPHDKGQCDCRKPKPGLFRQAMRDFPEICAGNCLMIGDSLSDIEAAHSLGFRAILIQTDQARSKLELEKAAALADATAASLLGAVTKYLQENFEVDGPG